MRKPEEIIINHRTLEQILIDHMHWFMRDCKGWGKMRADLRGTDLCYADLTGVDLRYAELDNANLRGADLHRADLSGAHLGDANLAYTYLSCAVLSGAYLGNANLYGADLRGTYLCGANLENANLGSTNLLYANLLDAHFDGAEGGLLEYRKGKILTEDIIGYKKCYGKGKEDTDYRDVIVTLLIPRGSIVFSINGSKCRTNKAKVIDMDGVDRVYAKYKYMTYYVGDEFNIYDFNCMNNVACGEGIHFFMSRQEAINYF